MDRKIQMQVVKDPEQVRENARWISDSHVHWSAITPGISGPFGKPLGDFWITKFQQNQ